MPDEAQALLVSLVTSMGEIKGSIGGIEARLDAGSQRHVEFKSSLEKIDVRTSNIEAEMVKVAPLSAAVSDMKPKVDDLVQFKGKAAAIMLAASTIFGGALWFIWEGIKFFWSDLQALTHRIFH